MIPLHEDNSFIDRARTRRKVGSLERRPAPTSPSTIGASCDVGAVVSPQTVPAGNTAFLAFEFAQVTTTDVFGTGSIPVSAINNAAGDDCVFFLKEGRYFVHARVIISSTLTGDEIVQLVPENTGAASTGYALSPYGANASSFLLTAQGYGVGGGASTAYSAGILVDNQAGSADIVVPEFHMSVVWLPQDLSGLGYLYS